MRRVLFYRLYDVVPARLAELEKDARAFTRSRAWRGDAFWLATENTTDLFAMEYFRHARNEEGLVTGRSILEGALVVADSAEAALPLVSHRVSARGVEEL